MTAPLWVREIGGFAAVGALSFVVQLVLLNVLLGDGAGPLLANATALVCSATVGYLGNRYLSFRHRSATAMGREAMLFGVVAVATFALGEAVVSLSYAVGEQHDRRIVNILTVLGIGLGTAIRLVAYRRFVFVSACADGNIHGAPSVATKHVRSLR